MVILLFGTLFLFDMKTTHIWAKYSEDIRRFILSKINDPITADDLLQETFIKVHTRRSSLKDKDKIKPWVFSIARYTVIDYFRERETPLATSDIPIEEESDETHTEHDCLTGIINGLPSKYKIPLIMADIKGIKQGQIAEELNMPLPTVKSRIQRGRKLVQKGFVNCCGFTINAEGFLVGELKDRKDCKVCN